MAPRSLDVSNTHPCRKRPADEELDSEPPIKKFELLNIVDEKNCVPRGEYLDEHPKSDGMLLDDTKYTSYIHDIDRELENIESEEEHIVFLPDIEKTLTAIPRVILEQPQPTNNELVLYRPPEYFTIPIDKRQIKEPPTSVIPLHKSRAVTANRVTRRGVSGNTDDSRSQDAQDEMDVDR